MEFCNETEMREYLEEHDLKCSHYTVTNFGVYANVYANVKEDNMLNISVNITPDQLVNSQALGNLAKALCELSGAKFEIDQGVMPVPPVVATQAVQPMPTQVPVQQPVMQQAPTQVPVAPQVVPNQQAPSAVPTAAPAFSHQQLAVAAMQLKDLGKLPEMQNLLAQFGVVAITQLPQEQLPAFAQGLQALGVKL